MVLISITELLQRFSTSLVRRVTDGSHTSQAWQEEDGRQEHVRAYQGSWKAYMALYGYLVPCLRVRTWPCSKVTYEKRAVRLAD